MSEDRTTPDMKEQSDSSNHSECSEPSPGCSSLGTADSKSEKVDCLMPADSSGGSEFCDVGDPAMFSLEEISRGRHGVTSSSPCRGPPDPVSAAALFDSCEGVTDGQVPTDRLLQHLRAHLSDSCRGWLQSVSRVLDPNGEDTPVTADMFRDAVTAVSRTEAEMLQPGTVPENTPPSPSPPAGGRLASAGRFSIGSRASSLGILHASQLLDSSGCSSYEGLGQQPSPVDIPALESTIAQLRHSGRALQQERDQLQQQLQQLEDTNTQLAAEVAHMEERNTSMSAELQRIPSLRQEAERLQSALEQETRHRAEQQHQAAEQERLISAQQQEMDLLASRLSAAELEVSRAAGRESGLHSTLEEFRREADLLRRDLTDRDERNAAGQATIAALHCTIREMRDTSLALQEEKSRTSHELSSVKKQLQTLRGSTPAGGDTSRSGPTSLPNNGSIHDEIINTIQTTGDGDPVLPLSGIASPELVQAICASPLNLHFKRVPRRLRMSSTPQSQPGQGRPSLGCADESAEMDERYSSAASDSYGSPEVWQSRPPSMLEAAVQTDCTALQDDLSRSTQGTQQEDGSTQTSVGSSQDDGSTQTALKLSQEDATTQAVLEPFEEGGAVQQTLGSSREDDFTQTEESRAEAVPGSESETSPCERRPALQVHQTTQTEPVTVGDLALLEVETSPEVLTEEVTTQTEPSPETEQDADPLWMWDVKRFSRQLCSDTYCATFYGAEQATLGDGAAPADLERRWLWTALRHADGLPPPLLHQVIDIFHQQETMFTGVGHGGAGGAADMKRTFSDGALSAPLRTRFCSMPTVEEVPDDPDTDMPQHSPLRASFSLPCDTNEVGVFPSLSEHMLADLHFHADENANNTNEKDLESKFCSLALAFKTDRLTLHERLDVQRRHRDQAEQNLDMEAQRFREQLMMLTQSDADRSEQMKALQRQLDIIKQISQRLSRTAEVLGAAQQELRVSRAVEVMTQHVESLRHLYEREHAELEEARRVLATNNIALHEPAQKTTPGGRRRASIAVFAPRPAGQPLGSPLGGLSPLAGHGSPLAGHGSPLGSHTAQLSPTSSSPGVGTSGLRRRRNSLGAGDADGFSAIKEEKEEERTEADQPQQSSEHQQAAEASSVDQLNQEDNHHQHQHQQRAEGEDLRSHVEEAVSDELATLRSEQEQLANDLKTLLSRQRDAVLQQTTTVGKLLWDVAHAWPYSREQTVVRARYCVGGLFLLLAVMVLLVPPAHTSCNTQPHAFYSWSELLSPHLSLRHVNRPPL